MVLIKIKAMGRKQFVGHFEALKCPNFAIVVQRFGFGWLVGETIFVFSLLENGSGPGSVNL